MHEKDNHRNCTKRSDLYLLWPVPLSLESGTNYCEIKTLFIFLLINKSLVVLYFKTSEQCPRGSVEALFSGSLSQASHCLLVSVVIYLSCAMDFVSP